jgi:hypothetical protein
MGSMSSNKHEEFTIHEIETWNASPNSRTRIARDKILGVPARIRVDQTPTAARDSQIVRRNKL